MPALIFRRLVLMGTRYMSIL